MTCVKFQAAAPDVIVRKPEPVFLIRINAPRGADEPDGANVSALEPRAMGNEFEWVDFALQAPHAMAESLDAAGIDGGIPCHGRDDGEPSRD
jgi:hypothetical protein